MKFANATKLDRKSGVAKWRDLQFSQPASALDGNTTVTFIIPTEVGSALGLFAPKRNFRLGPDFLQYFAAIPVYTSRRKKCRAWNR
jgi:hypothetical protein